MENETMTVVKCMLRDNAESNTRLAALNCALFEKLNYLIGDFEICEERKKEPKPEPTCAVDMLNQMAQERDCHIDEYERLIKKLSLIV